jgi:hypothetical protein
MTPSIYIVFTNPSARENWDKMLPRTQRLANEMALWLWDTYKIYFYLTETATTKEQDNALQRVSSTHRDGRAFDVRIVDPVTGVQVFPEDIIAKFCAYFRKKYSNLGAVSGDTRDRNLIVYKPHGSGKHLHIQIKRNA